jgi:hypothetical protein
MNYFKLLLVANLALLTISAGAQLVFDCNSETAEARYNALCFGKLMPDGTRDKGTIDKNGCARFMKRCSDPGALGISVQEYNDYYGIE